MLYFINVSKTVFWFYLDLKSTVRKLEHENADLRFLNNQYIHKMHSLELDSKQKTERILQLQEKNFHAVVQTPGMNHISLDRWIYLILQPITLH